MNEGRIGFADIRVFACCFFGINHFLLAQSPLAVANVAIYNDGHDIIETNMPFMFQAFTNDFDEVSLSTNEISTNDVGALVTINPALNANMAFFVWLLTNGMSESVGYLADGQGLSEPVNRFFAPLPAGNNGIDFQGFQIYTLSLLTTTLTFSTPGRNPNGDGLWTDVEFAGEILLNGDPLLLSPTVSRTIEIGDYVRLCAGIAGSPPTAYQWFFDDSNQIGNGLSFFQITNAQLSDSGVYSVVLTDDYGSLTNTPEIINVVPIVPRRTARAVSLTAPTGGSYTVTYSDTIGTTAAWTVLNTATVTTTPQFYFDTSESPPASRFYRAFQSSSSDGTSTLKLQTATEITVTGIMGDNVRVDYINSIGPTNAWVTLGTITLTNTSQPYFDASVDGQPPRLYRLTLVP
jgi:hypothetical protein